eukprot:comp19727_c0_seq1/m.23512 comp19727_c0_seq1/g.23512  ORF comp19727_c0_seq1/g.23512 comp19727_c0_seq1/m.23512 type:complete len:276 (-) comp19727_c0_seq1:791-1618(-)
MMAAPTITKPGTSAKNSPSLLSPTTSRSTPTFHEFGSKDADNHLSLIKQTFSESELSDVEQVANTCTALVLCPHFWYSLSDGRNLKLEQGDGDVGNHVWEGAVVLSRYLENQPADYLHGQNVLEVGAGMGLTGLVAATRGANVTLTDAFPHVLQRLRRNVDSAVNGGAVCAQFIDVAPLDWTCPEKFAEGHGKYDVILGADIIYKDNLNSALLSTLRLLLKPTGHVVIANGDRKPMNALIKVAPTYGFKVEKIECKHLTNMPRFHLVFLKPTYTK